MQLETEGLFISEIESEMGSTLERIPCSAKLLSIKGLGVVSVAGLIGEEKDKEEYPRGAEAFSGRSCSTQLSK